VRRSFDDNEVAEGAELGELVRKILRPHERLDGSGFIIEGPLVQLGAHATNGMALVLHELATNAAKYGALKSPNGRVSVRWRDVEGVLGFDWIESGATAPTATPLKTGFGTKLSEATIVKQFGGTISYRWNPAGLAVAITLPITRLSR
jgi:two-component sensor histidine kinase